MNQTMKIAVALIVAASLSTMVYALPEQRAMAHLRVHLLSPDSDPDDFPFGPNSPDPSVSASKSDPPPDPPGGNGGGNGGGGFGPNCVGCISTQNLANGAVTNPKLAPGSVSSSDIGAGQVMTPNIADHNITTSKIAPGAVSITTTNSKVAGDIVSISPGNNGVSTATCPSGTIATGGGFNSDPGVILIQSAPTVAGPGWEVIAENPPTTTHILGLVAFAVCSPTTIHN